MKMDCIYCTPEWLDECGRIYQATPRYQEAMKKLNLTVFFRVTSLPEWGIDPDMIFGGTVTNGALSGLRFYSEREAKEKGALILSASPKQWKVLLRKERKFISEFMLGKVKMEKGTIGTVLGVAPYADTFVDALTQVNLIFQDELSPQKLEEYTQYAEQFRARLGV
jgi:hypothetical protein